MFQILKYKMVIWMLSKMIQQTGWEMVCIADHGDSMEEGSPELIAAQKAHRRYSNINFALADYRRMQKEYLKRDLAEKKVKNKG